MTSAEVITRRRQIVRMWENTDLSKKEVSQMFDMSHSTVCTILIEEGAGKRDGQKETRDSDINPCTLSLKVWPRCYGQGCYWVSKDGESVCPAYNAMQK